MLSTVYQNMHVHFIAVMCQPEGDQSLSPELQALIVISGTRTLRQRHFLLCELHFNSIWHKGKIIFPCIKPVNQIRIDCICWFNEVM